MKLGPISHFRKLVISFKLLSSGLLAHTFSSGSYVEFKELLFYCAVNLDGGYLTWSNSPAVEQVLVNH
jgi:hypothetical protein